MDLSGWTWMSRPGAVQGPRPVLQKIEADDLRKPARSRRSVGHVENLLGRSQSQLAAPALSAAGLTRCGSRRYPLLRCPSPEARRGK